MPVQPSTIAARVAQIRQWMAASDREGTPRADLELQLTHRDLSSLKRSRDVLIDEISFANGVTTFLGVKIAEVAVPSSRLTRRAPA